MSCSASTSRSWSSRALCASLFMDNLTHATNEKRAMRDVCREPHAWVISMLYIGTFGSFIGFAFAFGQVLQVQFASTFDTPIKAAYLTFLGPLLGSLMRPVGGKLADRLGGARVTFWTFVAMLAAAAIVLMRVDRPLAGAVHRRVHRPVRAQRSRQRLDVQDDPGHLRRQGRQSPSATAPIRKPRTATRSGARAGSSASRAPSGPSAAWS